MLNLSNEKIISELKINKKIVLSNKEFKKLIKNIFNLNKKLLHFLKDRNITGYESTVYNTNPLLWTIGHICYFYEYHYLKYINRNHEFYITDGHIYDSFLTDKKNRFKLKNHSKKKLFEYLDYIKKNINSNLLFNNVNTYLLLLSILHNHMHCESIIFTKKRLGYKNIFNSKFIYKDKKLSFDFIKIKGGKFTQGNKEGDTFISFDNEMPCFKIDVKDFIVSKYPVTEELVLKFVKNGGYKNENLWCINGWRWIKENNINKPFYWVRIKNKYYINDNSQIRTIKNNLPACHISWYEAKAICKYYGGRLPTETEWEFLATNRGKTKYPWGNFWDDNVANIEYTGNICDVSKFKKGDSRLGVSQLIGNVWEWCEEPIYPYDGFKIDKVYKEFSYPFFGFKKILRGGSWAVPEILINSKYRNAQLPDTRIQFTGFRIVKN